MRYLNNKKQAGFTLVEMLIALGIAGILVAIAIPSFNKQSMRSKRSDALIALQQASAEQERYYAINSRYAALANPSSGVATVDSPQKLYTVSVTVNATGSTYTATATPAAGRSQTADSDCRTITLTNTGAKGSTGAFATAGDATKCWN